MLSSKPPPYSDALVTEARSSAMKVEGGFWTKSASASDYVAKVQRKLAAIAGAVCKTTPAETQRAYYEAAMKQQDATHARASSAAPASAPLPPTNSDAQLTATTLDLFDRKHQQSLSAAAVSRDAPPPSEPAPPPPPPSAPGAAAPGPSAAPPSKDAAGAASKTPKIVQAILKRYVDRPEFKAYVQTLDADRRKAHLAKLMQGIKRLLERYEENVAKRASEGHARPGLKDAALVEHIAGSLSKLMARVGGDGSASAGVGLTQQREMMQRDAAAAEARRRAERADASRRASAAAAGPSGAHAPAAVHEMAAYWKRLGEMRAAYLARARQTLELLGKKAEKSPGTQTAKNAEKFMHWMSTHLVPMLSQTAEAPFAGAKFTMAELDQISAQMTKLVAMTSKSQGAQAAAAQASGSAADGEKRRRGALADAAPSPSAASAGVAESASPPSKKRRLGVDDDGNDRREPREGDDGGGAADVERAAAAAEAAAEAAARRATRPSAFADALVKTSAARASGFGAAPVAALDYLKPKTPPASSASSGAPAVFEGKGGVVVAVRFSSDAEGYDAPDAELARGVFEAAVGEEGGNAAKAWGIWEEIRGGGVRTGGEV